MTQPVVQILEASRRRLKILNLMDHKYWRIPADDIKGTIDISADKLQRDLTYLHTQKLVEKDRKLVTTNHMERRLINCYRLTKKGLNLLKNKGLR